MKFEETTIELQRILSIQFYPSWAAGLAQLLRRLETDTVPRSSLAGPSAIAAWWAAHRSAEEGVLHEPDEHLSNHFPVTSWPTDLLVHELHRDSVGKIEIPAEIAVPCSQDGGALLSFASADELAPHLGPSLTIRQSRAIPCGGWHAQGCPGQFGPHIARILKMAWLNFVQQKGLPLHQMANQMRTLFFKAGSAPNDTVGYDWGEGRRSNRQVVGYKTITNLKTGIETRRHWHFGIDARPFTNPKILFMVKSHVLFSDDGRTIWDDDKKLLAARAGQCKNWWNPAWRDRLLGTMAWLAGDAASITLSLGGGNAIEVSARPTTHVSPVSYRDPGEAAWSDEDDVTEDDGEDTATETGE